MGFIVIIPFAALAVWIILRVTRKLRAGNYGPEWWRGFKILAVMGAGLGVWLGFFMEYNVPNNHIEGFPIPAGISTRQNASEPFVKAQMPALVRWGAMVTDVLCGIAFALLPIPVVAFFKENRGKGDFAGPGDPQQQPRA